MLKIYQNGLLKIVKNEWTSTDAKFIKNVEIVEDNEHTIDDFIVCDTEYILKTDERAIKFYKNYTRQIRNSYLEQYVDSVVSNPLRWADMTEQQKQPYIDYRRYLLDFTEHDGWWYEMPMTFEEWGNLEK